MVLFKYIEDLFQEEDVELIPHFDFCQGTPPMFTLMRLQSKLNIVYDEINGPVINDDNYNLLCRQAIKLAKSENVDIFITPEYAVPFSIIDEIATDTTDELRPSKRKIWCLCCEGIELSKFKKAIDRWEELGIRVLKDVLNNIITSNFVDTLIYIFKLENNTLCFVPQLKTIPMSDKNLECEARGMTCGETIYRIGKGKVNQLCTIICADALNYRDICLNTIFETGNENIIMLHPQLNSKPRYDAFSNLRHTLYNNQDGNHLIYITANCAFGTSLKGLYCTKPNETEIPWSCIYIKNQNDNWLEKERKFRRNNLEKGINYGFLDKFKLDVWYSIKEENIQIIKVIKPRIGGGSVHTPNINVLAEKLLQYSSCIGNWDLIDKYEYKDNIEDLIAIDSDDYKYPLEANKEERDKFFGLCFGDTEYGQLLIDSDEICKLVSIHVDNECEEIRRNLLNNYPLLVEWLNNRKLPKEFGILVDQHKFTLEDDIFNLVSTNSKDTKKIIVAYAPNEQKAKRIENIFKKLIRERINFAMEKGLEEEAMRLITGSNKINYCIFTRQDRTSKIITYPSFNTSIKATERVEDLVSIKR